MGLIDILYPKLCVGCRVEGQYICDKCQSKLHKPEQICPMCLKPSLDGWTHERCKSKLGMDRLIVALPYRGLVQDCLKKVKYKSSWDVINFLFKICNFSKVDDCIVTCVPMWKIKEKERGFNQADVLGKLVSDQINAKYLDLLERVRETKPMYGLKIVDRVNNIKGVFKTTENLVGKKVNTKTVILVDDVWTTGSTMKECSSMLKKSGFVEVWGITLAR